MKVCVYGTRGFPGIQGGVEKHCENLYPNMPKDISFTVCRRKTFVNNDAKYPNIEFIDLNNTRKRGIEAALHSFASAKYAIKSDCDIIHIHNIGPGMTAPMLKLFRKKVVLTYHSANYEHEKWNGFEKCILKFCEHVALKYSDKIIFVNKDQMSKYPQKIRDKSIYIPNGVNIPTLTDDISFLDRFNLKKSKYIISVGRITPEKGFDNLIKAYYQSGVYNKYKLAIVGGVEFESEYKNQLNKFIKDNNVIFTGYADGKNLAQLYQNARLYVISSINEGFPLVLLEAMSYGLDILASDIPANRMTELDDYDYFYPKDVEILAKKIKAKLSSVCQAKKYDLTQFDWKKIAEETANVYHSLI